jgi:FG-GAP-like repeat
MNGYDGCAFVVPLSTFRLCLVASVALLSGLLAPQPTWAQSRPSVETTTASEVTADTALLNASVNPNGADTLTYFQYGLTTNYSSETSFTNVGNGVIPISISGTAEGLLPSTNYHFRGVATNLSGISYGSDLVFTTATAFVLAPADLPGWRSGSAEWGDVDNDGNLDLLLAGNDTTGAGLIAVYRNLGNGQFTNFASITNVTRSVIAKWCDYDNNGLLDIVACDLMAASLYRNNSDGTFTRQSILPSSPFGYTKAALAPGDFDNDGRQDILLFGTQYLFGTTVCLLYWNIGNGSFGNVATILPAVYSGAAAWGDFDNDGKADVLISGITSSSTRICQLYRNLGNGAFTNMNAGLPGIGNSSVAWGDYDRDGKLDIILSGATNVAGNSITRIYRNLGGGAFTNINASLPGLTNGTVAWGDFDGDGWADIVIAGSGRTTVYRNNRDGSFAEINAPLIGVNTGSAVWGDCNNDGRLDLVVCGSNALAGAICQVYQNVNTPSNTMPSTPTGLSTQLATNTATLTWLSATDAETGSTGLTYNVRVGTTPGGGDILSANSSPEGLLRLPRMGNVDEVTNWTLRNLAPGPYYWSVQAVDAGYSGSAFATEQSFLIALTPQISVGNPYNSSLGDKAAVLSARITPNGALTAVTVNWGTSTNLGNVTPAQIVPFNATNLSVAFPLTNLTPVTKYYYQFVAINIAGETNSPILNFITYSVPSVVTQWVSAVQSSAVNLNASINPNGAVGGWWFEYGMDTYYDHATPLSTLDYSRSPFSVGASVRDLQGGTIYHYRVVATNFIGTNWGSDMTFQTTTEPTAITLPASAIGLTDATLNGTVNPNGHETGCYFEYGSTTSYGKQTTALFAGDDSSPHALSAPVSGLLAGATYHYRTVGTNTSGFGFGNDMTFVAAPPFTNLPTQLPGSTFSAAAFGDFDNDGKMDFVLSGEMSTGLVSQIYHNDGNGQFTDINAGLPGLHFSSVAWGDYDNDGWIDLLICGRDSNSTTVTKVYRNNHDTTFTEVNAGLVGVEMCCLWGDFDNDGWLDVLVVGQDANNMGARASIHHNDGNGNFSPYGTGLTPVRYGAADVSDFNRDGKLDIAILGNDGSATVTKIYRNNGDGSFTDIQAGLAGVMFGSLAWGDYDDDGYPDLAITGTGPGYVTKIYHNNNGETFTEVSSGMVNVMRSSIAWGDYDNDGYLDLLVAGRDTSNSPVTRIYRNNHGTNFVSVEAGLPQVWLGAGAWADIDNDGRLDILVTGLSPTGSVTTIHQNVGPAFPNTAPTLPTNLFATVVGSGVQLNWTPGSDAETPANGLTHNLRVGISPGGCEIVSPMSSSFGVRRLAHAGNAYQDSDWTLTNLSAGTYFWSVQTVDTGFMGSPFSPESSFVIGPPQIAGSLDATNGLFCLRFRGNSNTTYEVYSSTDLHTWVSIGFASRAASGQFEFLDSVTENSQSRFYRIRAY